MDRVLIILFMGVCAIIGLSQHSPVPHPDRINGVSLVAPRDSTDYASLVSLREFGVDWVAVIPFAFSRPDQPDVTFDHERQWWGERTHGVFQAIQQARNHGLKVMIKPHVWVRGDGWPGEFTLQGDIPWKQWENDYEKYILAYAAIAQKSKADLFCIGTEYRLAVRARPEFWSQLIAKVRDVYSGPLTYAANWDNYEQVSFWSELDYIGIDAYFPLSENARPDVNELTLSWKSIKEHLASYGEKYERQILFTEFGYRSTEYAADGHWKHQLEELAVDHQAQVNGYEALLGSFWNEPWIAGGFLWKWHMSVPERADFMDKAYSPQEKPALDIIRKHYSTSRSPIPNVTNLQD